MAKNDNKIFPKLFLKNNYTTGKSCVIINPEDQANSISQLFLPVSFIVSRRMRRAQENLTERITRFGEKNQEVSQYVSGQDPHLP